MSITVLVITVLDVLLGTTILYLNGVTIVAIVRHERLMTRSNMYVLSLAVSDALIGLVQLCIAPLDALGRRSDHVCCIILALVCFAFLASIMSVALIAGDRYLYIARPFLYERIVNEWRVKMSILIIWVLASLYAAWVVIFHVHIQDSRPVQCVDLVMYPNKTLVYATFSLFIACMIFTGVMYIGISRTANRKRVQVEVSLESSEKRSGTSISSVFGSKPRTASVRSLRRFFVTYRLFSTVFTLQIVCYFPLFTSRVINTLAPFKQRLMMRGFLYLAAVNSALNVFVYARFNRDIRAAMKSTVCCRKATDLSTSSTVVYSPRRAVIRINSAPVSANVSSQTVSRESSVPTLQGSKLTGSRISSLTSSSGRFLSGSAVSHSSSIPSPTLLLSNIPRVGTAATIGRERRKSVAFINPSTLHPDSTSVRSFKAERSPEGKLSEVSRNE